MENERRISALDLFAGAGGFSLGMQEAGIDVVAAVELDSKIAATYEYNHPDTVMINKDIREVDVKREIEPLFEKDGREVDLIFGGPPCQGFSMAGYRNRKKKPFLEDERNMLYVEYIRVVENLQPKVFIIENVPGIINFEDGRVSDEIRERFSELGYEVFAKILSAENYGVPQKRKRAFFIGNKIGVPSIELFPEPILKKESDFVTVRQALEDLPYLESGEGEELSCYSTSPKSSYQKIMRKVTGEGKFYNHIAAVHKPSTIKILKKILPGQTMKDLPEKDRTKSVHSGAYGRMDPDSPAYTITTRINTPSVGRITHPVNHRTITPREAARIQSFPDHYRFLGDITTVGIQIGNSVPPILAQAIGKKILEYL